MDPKPHLIPSFQCIFPRRNAGRLKFLLFGQDLDKNCKKKSKFFYELACMFTSNLDSRREVRSVYGKGDHGMNDKWII